VRRSSVRLVVGRHDAPRSTDMSGTQDIAALAYVLVVAGSIIGVFRAFSAVFSPRARASIGRHLIVHVIWFIIAGVVICDILVKLSNTSGQRPSPNAQDSIQRSAREIASIS
jgi:hypothetical protein